MDIKIPMGDGKEFTWPVCNVPKLVEYFAEEAPAYRLVMGRAFQLARRDPLAAILYLDEVTPGMVLRPDNHRKFWALYMAFEQMGMNNLFREEMWLPIAVLRTNVAHKVGVSCCVKWLLRAMLLEPTKLATVGFAIQLSSPVLMRTAVKHVLADEAALKATLSTKGASGLRCCSCCRNVVSLHSNLVAGQEYIADCSCCGPSRFDPTTYALVSTSWLSRGLACRT